MVSNGVTVPDELESFSWERCPDLNGQPVIRLVSDSTSWLLWQSSSNAVPSATPRDCLIGFEANQKHFWRACSVPPDDSSQSDAFINAAYLPFGEDVAQRAFFAVQLGSINSLDVLIQRFGSPPSSVQSDWAAQTDRAMDSFLNRSLLLSHILVATDGQLITLPSLEATVKESIERGAEKGLVIKGSLPDFDQGIPNDIPKAGEPCGVTLGVFLETAFIKIDAKLTPTTSLLSSKWKATPTKPIKTSIKAEPQRSKKIVWIVAATAGLLAISGFALWPSAKSDRVALRTAELQASVLNEKKETAVDPNESLTLDTDVSAPLELTTTEQLAFDDTLANQASDSLQKLWGGIGVSESKFAMDSVSFETVEALLKKSDDNPSPEPSPLNPTVEDLAGMPTASPPFGEPLGMDNLVPLIEEPTTASTGGKALLQPPAVEGQAEQGFLAQSIAIQQAQGKKSIRVPFKTNERQAVCRAKLKIADDMLLNPVEPFELVGRQDTVWTVAFKDDSVRLLVYLRTKPAKSWYIATSIRAKLGPGIEFPIGPQDATQVCSRLQNYSRWLEQNRQLCESMKDNKKMRATAIAGLDEIQKKMKATDKLLKTWIAIEELARVFYSNCTIEVELASSHELLPEMANEKPEPK